MKKAFITLFVLLLMILVCSSSTADEARNITIMLYLCGSDLDSGAESAATNDLMEIKEAVSGNASVTVLALAGGAKAWGSALCNPSETILFEIGSRGGPRAIQSYPAMNMGDPNTLSTFLKLGVELRPASQYALILWNHGQGSMGGVCIDALNKSDSLSLKELHQALEDSPFSADNHLSWIGFDACLMASVETAICVKDYADYMVASQETEPTSGWNYDFLRDIQGHTTGLEMCRNIVTGYENGKKSTDMLTLSLVDLSEMDALAQAINQFFQKINPILTKRSFSDFSRIRLGTKGFGRASTASDYDLVDLYDFSEQFANSKYFSIDNDFSARPLQTALLLAVKQTTGNQDKAHGLSLYSPYFNKNMFSDEWYSTYQNWDYLEDYTDYLSQFSFFWTGEHMTSWENLTGRSSPLTEQGTQQIELRLTNEQISHFASAYCLILEDDGSEYDYYNTYLIDDIVSDGSNLKVDYSFDALYAIDENGVVETDAIPFEIRDGYYIINAVLLKKSMLNSAQEDEKLYVMLQCKKDAVSDELEICSIIPVNEGDDGLNLGRNSVDLNPNLWPYILFVGTSRTKETDLNGSLLPFPEWHSKQSNSVNYNAIDREGNQITPYEQTKLFGETLPSGIHSSAEADNSRPWKLKFMKRKATGKEMVAQFIIQDTQGYIWGSNLIPLKSPDIRSIASVRCDPIEQYGCIIEPFVAKTIVSDWFQGVCVRFRFKSGSNAEANMLIANPIINGITSPDDIIVSSRAANEEEDCIEDIYIDLNHMPFSDDPVIRTISCILRLPSHENQNEMFHDRITLGTNLDVSMLLLSNRPEERIIDHMEEEEIEFRLIDIKESEDFSITGTIHLLNHGSVSKWVMINKLRDDTAPAFYINGYTVRNCVSIQEETFLLPGGEAYLNFEIYRNPGQSFYLLGYGDVGGYDDVDVIEGCGFSVMLVNKEDVIKKTDGSLEYRRYLLERDGRTYLIEGGLSYAFWFELETPLHLSSPIHVRYVPEYSQ